MLEIVPLVADLFMEHCHTPSLLYIVPAPLFAVRQPSLLPRQSYPGFFVIPRIVRAAPVREHCQAVHGKVNAQEPLCFLLFFHLIFVGIQDTCIILPRRLPHHGYGFKLPLFRYLPVRHNPHRCQLRQFQTVPVQYNISIDQICRVAVPVAML